MSLTWDDLPPAPWPANQEPTAEVLADHLLSLSREQLVWLLSQQRVTWRRESEFERNHEGQIEHLQRRLGKLDLFGGAA